MQLPLYKCSLSSEDLTQAEDSLSPLIRKSSGFRVSLGILILRSRALRSGYATFCYNSVSSSTAGLFIDSR